jgi:ATP-dependent RNA helicase RhlE
MSDNMDSLELKGFSPELSALRGAKQKIYFAAKKRKMELCEFVFKKRIKGNLIIFRKTQFGADKIMKMLDKRGMTAVCIHTEKTANERADALKRFSNDSANILVITDKAFKNITVKKADMIINFDVPAYIEDFVARFGTLKPKGAVHTFCAVDEKPIIKEIEAQIDRRFLVNKDHPFNDDLEEFTSEARRTKNNDIKSNGTKSRKSAGSKNKKKRWY